MITALEILIWLCVLIIINAFLIYPVFLFIVNFFIRKNNRPTTEKLKNVSILFAAYNEENVIEERIENIASLNYDIRQIEVIAGSDLSNDSTNEILKRLSKKYDWLKIYISKKRLGKAGILNTLVPKAVGEIIVFTDANTMFHQDAIKNLIKNFSSRNIGGVSGRLILSDAGIDSNEGVEETKYWALETHLKNAEGKLGILMGANGAIFAIKSSLFENIPTVKAVTDDLFISLNVIVNGFKVKYEPSAIAFENVGLTVADEFNRKARYSATNYQTLFILGPQLFSKGLLISYAFFSHRLSRWFLPFLLVLILILSIFLSIQNNFYISLLAVQVVFYLFAAFGWILNKFKVRLSIFSLPYFFVMTNAAIITGFFKFLNKKHSVIWDPTKRN